ncbi:MAG: hypothetical protein HC836_50360 [Richelia sp. RM2_1_2]|nr:hypothetical protein [Richelia sp. RM2_1_2]
MIPNENTSVNSLDTEKIDVWLFMDVSGSCVDLKDRFWKAYRSIPTAFFNIVPHVFDDGVRRISKNEEIRVGGGTSFDKIEEYIRSEVKGRSKYPHIVFVITDGQGTPVVPLIPSRWVWFMPKDNFCTTYCNQNDGSTVYMLDDFE